MLTLARYVLYLLAALALAFSSWVHIADARPTSPYHSLEIAMPDPYHRVTLYYLGYLPGAEALMLATEAPPDKVYFLPRNLCGGVPDAGHIGYFIHLRVSTWWLRRHGLGHLLEAPAP